MQVKTICLLILIVVATLGCSRASKQLPEMNDKFYRLYDADKDDYRLYADKDGYIWSSSHASYDVVKKLDGNLNVIDSIKTPGFSKIAYVGGTTIWSFDGSLLARSIDNGKTWDCFSKNMYGNCNKTITDNNFQMIKSIISKGGEYILGTYDGIYKSSDNGNTWHGTYVGEETGNHQVFDMISDNSIVYASVQLPTPDISYGIIESSDNGQTWKTVVSLGNYLPVSRFIGSVSSERIYALQPPDVVVVLAKENKEWKAISHSLVKKIKESDQCNFDFSVTTKGDILASCSLFTSKYEGGDFPTIRNKGAYLLKSLDFGKSWQEVKIDARINFISDIAVLPSDELVAATNLGITKIDYNK